MMNREKDTVFLIISIVMAIVYIGQTMLWTNIYDLYLSNSHSLTESRYEFRIEDINKEELEVLINNLPSNLQNYADIQMRKFVSLKPGEGNDNTHSITVAAFYPSIYSQRYVQILTNKSPEGMNESEVFYTGNAGLQTSYFNGNEYTSIAGNFYTVRGEGVIVDEDMIAAGDSKYMTAVWMTENDFFSISDKLDRIIIQYPTPLSISQEQILYDYMNSELNIGTIIEPYSIGEADQKHIEQRVVFTVISTFICLMCNYGLIEFYLGKRREEYDVFRMFGATKFYVFWKKYQEILSIVVCAALFGSLLFVFIGFLLKDKSLSTYGWMFWVTNIGLFLLISTLLFIIVQMINAWKFRKSIIVFEEH